MNKWLSLAKMLAPIVIGIVKPELSPISGKITDAITYAESIPNAKGMEKLKYVQGVAEDAAEVLNAAQGRVTIDTTNLHSAVEDSVNAVVHATNVVVKRPATL
jgi:hypothetical protein